MHSKNSLNKMIIYLEESINPNSIEDNPLFDKLGQLIKKSEQALGFAPLPRLNPNKSYSQEELIRFYQREY